jgi:hypothetical protein
MYRTKLSFIVSIVALLIVGSLTPIGAAAEPGSEGDSGDFPAYGEDKFLGSFNRFDHALISSTRSSRRTQASGG